MIDGGVAAAPGRSTLSILMPNYNHARYLPDSLGALCRQTRMPDEILVLDDGSTDQSYEIIQSYANRYPVIRVLRNMENKGLQYSINKLVAEARGDYIACAAADDMVLPEFVAAAMEVLERHPDAGLSFSEFLIIRQDGSRLNCSHDNPSAYGFADLAEYEDPQTFAARFASGYVWISSNTVVARRDALIAAGGFIDRLEWHADWFAFYVVALRHGVCPIRKELAAIRQRPGSYSDAGIRDWRRQSRVLKGLADVLAERRFRDLRALVRRFPGIVSVFGGAFVAAVVRRPRHWDLLVPYCLWYFRQVRRSRGLTLGAALYRAAAYLLRTRGGRADRERATRK